MGNKSSFDCVVLWISIGWEISKAFGQVEILKSDNAYTIVLNLGYRSDECIFLDRPRRIESLSHIDHVMTTSDTSRGLEITLNKEA